MSKFDNDSYERTVSALLRTDVCMTGTLNQDIASVEAAVAGWDEGQREQAFLWAMTEHLRAGDNDEVPAVPCPPFVQALRPTYGLDVGRPAFGG